MFRVLLLILAVVSFVLNAFWVASPNVNGGHPFDWLALGFAFWAASFIPLDDYARRGRNAP